MSSSRTGGVTTKPIGSRVWPWSPRFWHGMRTSVWFSLVRRNRFRVSPSRWAMAGIITFFSPLNSALALMQRGLYGRRLRRRQIEHDPIFVIGHWRSGTTLLHELLVLDERFTYPDSYAVFAPDHFLVSAWLLKPLLWPLIPSHRPMDNMLSAWHLPQEDEFALCTMGLRSPYNTIAFPNEPPQDQNYLTFDGVGPGDVAAWQAGLLEFVKRITLRSGKPPVLKSPPHTGRVRVLLDLFPRARFVHISRDPAVLFASTVNLWKRLYETQGLQHPRFEGLEEHVLDSLERMYAAYERDRLTVPHGQLCEIRYEDLVARPLEIMRRVYDEIELGGFETVRPKLDAYFAAKADYKTNKYSLSPQWRDAVARRWAGYAERFGYVHEDHATPGAAR